MRNAKFPPQLYMDCSDSVLDREEVKSRDQNGCMSTLQRLRKDLPTTTPCTNCSHSILIIPKSIPLINYLIKPFMYQSTEDTFYQNIERDFEEKVSLACLALTHL